MKPGLRGRLLLLVVVLFSVAPPRYKRVGAQFQRVGEQLKT